MFVSFDAEELCLRGSRAFFRRHRGEFTETKTWNFNVDCPYFVGEMKFLTSDIQGFIKLSSRLATRLTRIAHEMGYLKATPMGIMPLGGGTDAAETAKIGIKATCLVGIPYSSKDARGRDNVYHTTKDTIDAVEPEIVEATIGIFLRFIEEIDNGKFP
jgi:Zn-dependent M28 family amino/carboxypeptidase